MLGSSTAVLTHSSFAWSSLAIKNAKWELHVLMNAYRAWLTRCLTGARSVLNRNCRGKWNICYGQCTSLITQHFQMYFISSVSTLHKFVVKMTGSCKFCMITVIPCFRYWQSEHNRVSAGRHCTVWCDTGITAKLVTCFTVTCTVLFDCLLQI